MISAMADACRQAAGPVRKPLQPLLWFLGNRSRAKGFELSGGVPPAALARSDLLRRSVREHTAIGKQMQRSRRRPSKINSIAGLVDGSDMSDMNNVTC